MVANAAAVRVITAGSQRIKEAGCETAETAVAESRIRLLILKCIEVKAKLFERFPDALILAEVQQVVAERASDQELHGEVIDNLCLIFLKSLAGTHPLINDVSLNNICHCLIKFLLAGVLDVFSVEHAHAAAHFILKGFLIKSSTLHESCIILEQMYSPFNCQFFSTPSVTGSELIFQLFVYPPVLPNTNSSASTSPEIASLLSCMIFSSFSLPSA